MRLNLFVYVFLGTYPCLLFSHALIHKLLLNDR
jgi:hypothetical protein